MNYDKAKDSFEQYIKQFDMYNQNINIKYHHTYYVVRLMEKLAKRMHLADDEVILAKIIGLLHDIGRFPQIKAKNQMNDLKTKINHSVLGCEYLFSENHIRDFISTNNYDEIIKNAILNHNCLAIKEGLDEKSLLFAKMIRDMDKVDIFRVLASYDDFELIKEEVSEEALQAFKEKKLIEEIIIKTKSDETLKYLAFVFDINFQESYELLEESDNLALFISSLNIPKYSEDFASGIIAEINNYLQEKLKQKEECVC